MNSLVPALVSEISQYQPAIPQPPSSAPYVGQYLYNGRAYIRHSLAMLTRRCPELAMSLGVTASGALYANSSMGLLYFAFISTNVFYVDANQASVPCLESELLGLHGEYGATISLRRSSSLIGTVYYTITSTSTSFTIPGILVGITFVKATASFSLDQHSYVPLQSLRPITV
jgi:hypothetical protein